MAHRRWLVLLLFAAVFAMHGLQCIGADATGAGSGHVMTLSPSASGTAFVNDASPAGHAMNAPAEASAVVMLAPLGMATAETVSSGRHPAGLMGHLWTVCLAVLSVGLAVLLATLAITRLRTWLPQLAPGGFARARTHVRLPTPDLFALCVLRT